MNDLFSIAGKTALVTGGSRGIGLMIARGYVEAGARVYISSRKADVLDEVAAELSKVGECHAIAADLSTEAECRRLAEAVAARESSLDILVNNAGATWGAPLEQFDEAAWERALALNVKGVFHLTKFLVPLLEEAGTAEEPARVINIGSIDGLKVPLLDNLLVLGVEGGRAHAHPPSGRSGWRRRSRSTPSLPGPFESKMMAAVLDAFGEQIAANGAAQAHRPPRRHGRRRHLPRVTGRCLPHRCRHPGRRRHRQPRLTGHGSRRSASRTLAIVEEPRRRDDPGRGSRQHQRHHGHQPERPAQAQ